MRTLVTPLQVLKLAFAEGACLPPATVTEADIAAAEHRYIVPVIGPALYERLLDGAYADFRADYLAAPAALFTRLTLQPRLDVRTGQCGTSAPKSDTGQPADEEARRALLHTLRTEARAMLRRAALHLRTHADEFPEYNPSRDILNRCTTDGGFVQIR